MRPAVVIGAGPGVGRAVAHRFAREGHPIVLIGRTPATVHAVAATLTPGADVPVLELPADTTDEPALRAALDRATAELGPPEVVVYNAALIRADQPGELSLRDHQAAWAVDVGGALTAAAHTAPVMAAAGGGSFLVTGGMPVPDHRYTSLSLGKAALRAATTVLSQHYGPTGIHVATVTIAGPVAPGGPYDPDDIADHYWRLHTEPATSWRHEVVHGPVEIPDPA
jgi:NAD(P)-dependent dehydrogenase (short-subunit alcohol dehydrogenase family)